VSSETRVYATDIRTEWRFRLYWWLIHPGSALIRRMWLRAIRKRAEQYRDREGPAEQRENIVDRVSASDCRVTAGILSRLGQRPASILRAIRAARVA
jgi:hypothetical protein